MESRKTRDRKDRRLLEGEDGRFGNELFLRSARVLRKGALPDAEDLVSLLEPSHVSANSLDDSSHVHAGDWDLRFAQPRRDASCVRQTGHEMPNTSINSRPADVNKHVVIADLRQVDIFESQHLG